jgi:hypothetical protein
MGKKKENIVKWTKSPLLQTKENVLYNCAHWDTLQEFCLSTGTLNTYTLSAMCPKSVGNQSHPFKLIELTCSKNSVNL